MWYAQCRQREKHQNQTNNRQILVLLASDPCGNRTRVTAVKGRCLNRLTMEPYIYLSLCFSHDRNLIYHRLGCLASVFLNFLKNFCFSDFFLFSTDSKSFTCICRPHLVRFIIVITDPYVPYRSV